MLRPATVDDAERIAELHIASWRSTYLQEMPASYLDSMDVAARTVRWQQQLQQGMKVLVAVDSGELTGYVSSGPSHETGSAGRVWEIYNLHIHSSYKRQGIGSLLFAGAVRLGAEMGAAELTLLVVDSNSGARSFYEGHGMQVTGESLESFAGGEFTLPEVRYWMKLSAENRE